MHRIDGAGHIGGMFVPEDPAINRPPTEITPEWLNAAQEELAGLVEWAGLGLNKADNTQVRQALLDKFVLKPTSGEYATWLASGTPLPSQNIGPIWHDDYNSLMTWQSFTANGAAYTGYASVLIGGMVLDTQPTPRIGYVRSGVSNLSRTAYAALRGWAMHHGIMVASGVWAAGTIAVEDNPDGTTFRAYDVRGEFVRGWDDQRGVDSSRVFGSLQAATSVSEYAHSDTSQPGTLSGLRVEPLNPDGVGPLNSSVNGVYFANAASVINGGNTYAATSTVRPRNVALLAIIKY